MSGIHASIADIDDIRAARLLAGLLFLLVGQLAGEVVELEEGVDLVLVRRFQEQVQDDLEVGIVLRLQLLVLYPRVAGQSQGDPTQKLLAEHQVLIYDRQEVGVAH